MNPGKFVTRASRQHGVSRKEILGHSRRARIVKARWDAWTMAREAGWSLPEIGEAFNRHHTSILHGLRAAREAAGVKVHQVEGEG